MNRARSTTSSATRESVALPGGSLNPVQRRRQRLTSRVNQWIERCSVGSPPRRRTYSIVTPTGPRPVKGRSLHARSAAAPSALDRPCGALLTRAQFRARRCCRPRWAALLWQARVRRRLGRWRRHQLSGRRGGGGGGMSFFSGKPGSGGGVSRGVSLTASSQSPSP